jgi:CRISPR-associated protein Cas2
MKGKIRASKTEKGRTRGVGGNRPDSGTAEEIVGPAPRNRRQWIVVTYDIPDDKRRLKVMKALAGFGQWAQYSVFECDVRPADVDRIEQRLRQLMQRELDDIRLYPLCENCLAKVRLLGKAQLHRHRPFDVV